MSNPVKSEVKIGAVRELGCVLEDMQEKATQEKYRVEGGARMLEEIDAALAALLALLTQDLKNGTIMQLDGEPEVVADYVKRYLGRVAGTVDNLRKRSTQQHLIQRGMEAAFAKSVGAAKVLVDAESAKIEETKDQVPGEAGRPRMSAAEDIAQRRQEAKDKKPKGRSGPVKKAPRRREGNA